VCQAKTLVEVSLVLSEFEEQSQINFDKGIGKNTKERLCEKKLKAASANLTSGDMPTTPVLDVHHCRCQALCDRRVVKKPA
jgi:hypothetical protein